MKVLGIDVEVERKPIKNTHLSVYPPNGRVHISVPEGLSDKDIRSFVVSHLAWVRREVKRIRSQPRQTRREYVSGESIYCLGKRYRLSILVEDKGAVERIAWGGTTLRLFVREGSSRDHRGRIVESWQKEMLKSELGRLMGRWCVELKIEEPSWRLQRMKSRWGSCNRTKRAIIFNTALARVPSRCVEYVVVHELTHLDVANHGAEFQMLLSARLPRHASLRKELNEFIALPYER